MKIITINQTGAKYYNVTVCIDNNKNVISQSKYLKTDTNLQDLLGKTKQFWGIETCREYYDHCGVVVVEGK